PVRLRTFETPTEIVLPMRIDKSKRQLSARNKFRAQLRDEVEHLVESRVRKNRVREYGIELSSEIRNRKIDDAVGIERAVVAIVMGPVRLGERAATVVDRVFDYVDAVVIAPLDLTSRIKQDVSAVAAEIEHQLAAPIRMVQLLVEIS